MARDHCSVREADGRKVVENATIKNSHDVVAFTRRLIMRKFHQVETTQTRRYFPPFVKLIIVVMVVALFVEVWAVNRLSTSGAKINELKRQQAALQLQNQVLEDKVAQSASLRTIASQSGNLGFGSIKNIEYIKAEAIALNAH